MRACIAAPIGRCLRGGSSFRKGMDIGRWGSPRWKTRSSSVRVVEVLNAIYEEDFLGFSYGFRPGRSQHDALDALAFGITRTKVNYILDCDIRRFFDSVSHEWLVRFVEHRIGDPRVIRLIRKWLKAGVMEDGDVVSDGDRDPARFGDLTVARQRLPALLLRPMGRAVATSRGPWQRHLRALRRRYRRRL